MDKRKIRGYKFLIHQCGSFYWELLERFSYFTEFNPERIPEKNKFFRSLKNAATGIKQFKKHPGKIRKFNFDSARIHTGY
ncbi:MAG: hypothetical protein U5Q03_00895 [Bacteroidota bacterium]|nr:hypothetical protein [Bacteroidota bacterium]